MLIFSACSSLVLAQEWSAWDNGFLDIHHIQTGRGNATFCVFPDGTTLLIDAGDTSETHSRTLSSRNTPLLPNRSKTAPEWIIKYIKQYGPRSIKKLDYALITHYHDDHFGEIDSIRLKSEKGNYFLTGITSVGDALPIKFLIDRGDHYPVDLRKEQTQSKWFIKDPYNQIKTLKNYWNFIEFNSKNYGLERQTLEVGRKNQIRLLYSKGEYVNFEVQNIAANGIYWLGKDTKTDSISKQGEYPGENPLSLSIKISYGSFDYVTSGDLSGVDQHGSTDFDSMESLIAPAIGIVDVATLNHHGNRDSQNSLYVRTIRPRVWIGQTWSSDHPDNNVLRRILSKKLYPLERDLFATAMLPPNRLVLGNIVNQYTAQEGHVVVRVYPGGRFYKVFVFDASQEHHKIIGDFGPYQSN